MRKPTVSHKPKSGYWYSYYVTECVLCGATDTSKERVYDRPRPESRNERWEFVKTACDCHFL